jgi:CBS domain-containing protein
VVGAPVARVNRAGEPIAGGEHQVEGGRGDADQRLDAPAQAPLGRGQCGQVPGKCRWRRLAAVRIRDVMTESVVTAAPDASVREVAETMRERNVGSVVLVERGRPVGFLTDRDLTVSVLADGRDPSDRACDYASTPVVTGAPDMDITEAAELMVEHGIRRLPVLDGEKLTGIVTLDDLAVRTCDAELAMNLASAVTRAAMPEFYFHHRGG